ncbi:MAG: putative metal-binding motif-containing protein, partial [Deltaproteobacteria bacterium]|nr:putative metal-binding motif-containing protein [Deltaproteobacteria bacterium]
MKHKIIQRQSLWLTFLLLVVFFVVPLTDAQANVTIITPTVYVVAGLQVGDEYYLDRTYTLTSVPSELTEGEEEWIKTKKKDKANTSVSFLEFTISQDSTIYIGYDTRATSLPDWLTSKFVSTPLIIGVSEVMGHFDVYKQNFSAGTSTLGGNFYIVIVKPYTPVPEICDNGIDDDLDSLIDCADADCSADPACQTCQTCTDADSDNYYAQSDCGTAVDCDDNDPAVNPGAVEVCDDNKDNDCDGAVDCSDADCS